MSKGEQPVSGSKKVPVFQGIKRAINYVVDRQNKDGGYTFCQFADSNTQDTYYGLATLDLLETPFPNLGRTLEWLQSFVPYSIYSHYYVAKSLVLCNEKPQASLREFLFSLPLVRADFAVGDVYVEAASEFELAFMATELVSLVDVEIDCDKTAGLLLKYLNDDGGFGVQGNSSLNSTYHAAASLFNLGYPVKSLHGTLDYLRSCEKPYGGFTIIPRSVSPYMEHVYYGVSTLKLLGQELKYPAPTAEFVFNCQNMKGGFARSDSGIATFEDTFFAVSVLKMLNRL